MALPETCCHKKVERISCNKKSSLVFAFWKISRAFPKGRKERCCYFSAKKKRRCLKTCILRTVSGSAFNLLNKSCHVSHKTFSSFHLGFPEADPETVHVLLESFPRKNQQGCGQVGHDKEENHAEVVLHGKELWLGPVGELWGQYRLQLRVVLVRDETRKPEN